MDSSLIPRAHIQDHDGPNITEIHHWGYPSRVVPCTSGVGTCAYLDAVYWMHDVSMMYTFIMWGVLLGLAVTWVTIRGWRMAGSGPRMQSWFDKLCDSAEYAKRRWLLPNAPARWLFGRVSRLQVVLLAVMLGYLLIFSLVGIVYKTWITPVKGTSLFNTRTGLGGFADRVGALAYALTPFTILLSNRESMLSLITGIPYQHFNFLHRWLGRVIFVQSFLHTLGWTIIEGKLYKPQPSLYASFIAEQSIIFGVVAMFLITLMLVLSTQTAIRLIGYEAFKITHWIIAVLYIGACWGHWDKLWCWMVPSLALMVIDQVVRGSRTLYLHYGGQKGGRTGFQCAQAKITLLGTDDDLVVRLDFDYQHRQLWEAGQHFHICVPSLSIWQSHPYTPSSLPNPHSKVQKHKYLLRVRQGQTAQLAALGNGATVPCILTGAYGRTYPSDGAQNILCVAGGTGVTFTLPILLAAIRQQRLLPFVLEARNRPLLPRYAVNFVWVVRRAQDLLWLSSELESLRTAMKEASNVRVKIFVSQESETSQATDVEKDSEKGNFTRETSSASSGDVTLASFRSQDSDGFSVAFLGNRHPAMTEIVNDFVERSQIVGGAMEIVGSGPEAMGSDLRTAVARVRDRESIDVYWDSRD
ncbi:hypothetical protein LTR08_001069 [Meristemomyces frigidus]|nr:hypothetical protein LTR08_001069 [Meristemomyces frigidus]